MDVNQMQRGQQWLEELLRLSGLPAVVTAELNSSFAEESYWLTIDEAALSPDQIELITGPGGSVLDSIQYLTNAILNLSQERDQQKAFTVELAGYRLRRYAELKDIADQAAAAVRKTGTEFELKSLSSAERRQVHTMLKEYGDLETFSRGQEPDRRLVIRPLQG
ncbi:protein jag [Stenomitos frigidus]|uniref:RNA-binding protein n=1 Tax=Stenomitos frigidus ULC18 TaxID=2107698 RepID=A0A2T1DZT9_9CYAN|nr:R3H domain-containing nucleic acid-binding protein [Stenomitos frigidus]PSB25971.1 RNA-binding protein [Stenomitos frigidus ULC18]